MIKVLSFTFFSFPTPLIFLFHCLWHHQILTITKFRPCNINILPHLTISICIPSLFSFEFVTLFVFTHIVQIFLFFKILLYFNHSYCL